MRLFKAGCELLQMCAMLLFRVKVELALPLINDTLYDCPDAAAASTETWEEKVSWGVWVMDCLDSWSIHITIGPNIKWAQSSINLVFFKWFWNHCVFNSLWINFHFDEYLEDIHSNVKIKLLHCPANLILILASLLYYYYNIIITRYGDLKTLLPLPTFMVLKGFFLLTKGCIFYIW